MRFSARFIEDLLDNINNESALNSSQYVQIVKTEDWKKLKMEIQIKAYDKLMIQTLKGNTKTLTISED